MPAKKKTAKSAQKSKLRDLKPSKDAKGGTGPTIKPGFGGGRTGKLN